MKRLLLSIFLCLCMSTSIALARTSDGYNSNDWLRCTNGVFDGSIVVTDTNTKVDLDPDTKAIYIKNRGANEVYVDPRDGVAVASDDDGGILINPGESRDLSAFQTNSIGLIASSAESTTVQLDICY